MIIKKSKIKLLVDIIMLFLFIINAGIGLLLKFAITKRSNIYSGFEQSGGTGFIGLSRADWLSLHWVLSLILIALIVVHLMLNFKTISHYLNRKFIPKIPAVYLISFINFLLCIILIASLLINSDERQDQIHSEQILSNEIKPASKTYSAKYRNKIFFQKMKPVPARKKTN
jgi:Na+/proline symporter